MNAWHKTETAHAPIYMYVGNNPSSSEHFAFTSSYQVSFYEAEFRQWQKSHWIGASSIITWYFSYLGRVRQNVTKYLWDA